MTLSPLDSALWRGLYSSEMAQRHLADDALLAAMVRVEAALGVACGSAGLIPRADGVRLSEALADHALSPAQLSGGAAADGVPVPALLAALRNTLDPDLADALHWGATSQDIVDTATMLCLRAFAADLRAGAEALLRELARIAGQEADTLQLARTRTQAACPTTFGATVALWGCGIEEAVTQLEGAARGIETLSLHGAAGTDGALGPIAGDVRAHMAEALGLRAGDVPWHTLRARVTAFGAALAALAAAAGRIGSDLAFLASSGIAEVRLAGGGSSAMPHKVNPVRAEAAEALARHAALLQSGVAAAAIHGSQRDGVAWGIEWLSLRPLCGAGAAALENVALLVASLAPDRERMARNLSDAGPGILSERMAYALAGHVGRAEARRAVARALAVPDPVAALRSAYPDVPWHEVTDLLAAASAAPVLARAFAAAWGGKAT